MNIPIVQILLLSIGPGTRVVSSWDHQATFFPFGDYFFLFICSFNSSLQSRLYSEKRDCSLVINSIINSLANYK
jgi:hypothetical protein